MAQAVRERAPELQLVLQPQYCNVCFWFVPRILLEFAPIVSSTPDQVKTQIAAITRLISSRVNRGGVLLVDVSPLESKGLPAFFRAITSNPGLSPVLIDRVLDEISTVGRMLQSKDWDGNQVQVGKEVKRL